MIDFHTHILPGMDDGPDNVEMSMEMLKMSVAQGVDTIVSTSHFYAYDESPSDFIRRRSAAFYELQSEINWQESELPKIILGSEVLYFPGICDAAEIAMLKIGGTDFLLIEPPMMKWSDNMLDEIEQTGENLHCIPVIAHIDRYIKRLGDTHLFEKVNRRKILVQANASFFLNNDTFRLASAKLKSGEIHFIGSDCHDNLVRPPNLGNVCRVLMYYDTKNAFEAMNRKISRFFGEQG